jgi:hypothetical protein
MEAVQPTLGATSPTPIISQESSCGGLSSGSATFIFIVLIFGCLSQPPGSLIVSLEFGYTRIWRLSPIFCLLEFFHILVCLLSARLFRIPQPQIAFMLLARRTSATHGDQRSLFDYTERPKLEFILPTVLQMVKVIFVRGSPLTTALAAMYSLDWILVQYCHAQVRLAPITKAAGVCRCRRNEDNNGICRKQWISESPDDQSALGIDPANFGWKLNREYEKDFSRVARWLSPLHMYASHISAISLCSFFVFDKLPKSLPVRASDALVLSAAYPLIKLGLGVFAAYFLRWVCRKSIQAAYPACRSYDRDFVGDIEIMQKNFADQCAGAIQIFGILLGYYAFYYNSSGTQRPGWLDWLG